MSESPTWLTPDPNAPPPPAATATPNQGLDAAPVAATPTNNAASGASGVTGDDDKDLPGIILTMRLANMGVATATITVCIWLLFSRPPLATWVLSIYAVCGGLLICCLETQLKFLRVMIAVNFGFLFNSVWRFLFYFILASVLWSFEWIVSYVTAGAMVFVACWNTYILCRYPAYRRIRERIAEEEDKRIEARISKEVKRQAVNQVMSGNN